VKKDYRIGTSLFMLFSFIALVPSGITLELLDQGGHETARHVAETVHVVSAIVFLISTLTHVFLNRRSVAAAVRLKTGPYPVIGRKAAVVAIIFAAIMALAVSHVFILG